MLKPIPIQPSQAQDGGRQQDNDKCDSLRSGHDGRKLKVLFFLLALGNDFDSVGGCVFIASLALFI